MRNVNSLVVSSLSDKISVAEGIREISKPAEGWVKTIRTAINMSRKQLAERMDISTEAVRQMEEREANDRITLKSLREAANAMDLQLSYLLFPKSATLEDQIREQAKKLATKIVRRTNQHMRLEAQELSEGNLAQAIEEATDELVRNLDQRIWNL